jgi:hypothetical protein
MSKEEVIELLESLKGDTSGNMQSIPETVYESIFNERIDEVIKKIKPKKISKEEIDLGEMINVWIEHHGSLDLDTDEQTIIDFYNQNKDD